MHFNIVCRILLTIHTTTRRIKPRQKGRAFFGHHDAPYNILPILDIVIEKYITDYHVTKFIVGKYGNFDRLATKAVSNAKKKHPGITLTLLLTYHPAERPVRLSDNFDELCYPPDMENVPRKFAIVKANKYAVDNTDYLIAHARYPGSNSIKLVEYAERKSYNVVNLASFTLPS